MIILDAGMFISYLNQLDVENGTDTDWFEMLRTLLACVYDEEEASLMLSELQYHDDEEWGKVIDFLGQLLRSTLHMHKLYKDGKLMYTPIGLKGTGLGLMRSDLFARELQEEVRGA